MTTKRFIAGAVCPRCAEMDRLVIFDQDGDTFKECVSCGYSEKQLAQVELQELDTRVNHNDVESEAVEPIKVMLATPKKVQ